METLQKQVSSLSGERDTLQKQIVSLTGERDTFEKRIAAIESGEASASADSGISWWVAASVGALASAIVAIAAYLLASRRGLVISPPKRARA
jgi:hypothetical protein